jgi:hypothetical protein
MPHAAAWNRGDTKEETVKEIDPHEYLAWLEQQKWVLGDEDVLTFFDKKKGPREFVETAPGEWSEMEAGHEDPRDDFTKVEDPRLVALLNTKKTELWTH